VKKGGLPIALSRAGGQCLRALVAEIGKCSFACGKKGTHDFTSTGRRIKAPDW